MAMADRWLAGLRDGNPDIRIDAIRQVDERSIAEQLPLLVSLLGDAEWRVRKAASARLKKCPPTPSLLESLLAAIVQDDNFSHRTAAMEVMVEYGSRESDAAVVVDALLDTLRTIDLEHRKFVIELLGQVASPRALAPLMAELREEDENHQLSTLDALARIGERSALPAMIDRLQHGTPQVRFAALSAIQQLADPTAVPAVVNALSQRPLRKLAMEIVGQLGDGSAVPPIWHWWLQGSDQEQTGALLAVTHIAQRVSAHDRSEVIAIVRRSYRADHRAPLMERLDSTDPRIQAASITVAGWVREPAALSRLVNLLGGDQAEPASRALSYMAAEHIDALLEQLPTATPTIYRALMQLLSETTDSRVLPVMREALASADGHVRRSAAMALAMHADVSSAPALVPLLSDPYPDVQEAALFALGWCRSAEVVGPVIELLTHASPAVRRNAVRALEALQAGEGSYHLSLALNDSDAGVRAAAIRALDALQIPTMTDHLLLALGDESATVRVAAVTALAGHVSSVPVERWVFLADDPDLWVRVAAARMAARSPDPQAARLRQRFLRDENGAVRIAALESMAERPEPGCLEEIRASLTSADPDVIRAALGAVASLATAMTRKEPGAPASPADRGGPLLDALTGDVLRCLTHESWIVRIESLRALARIDPSAARRESERHAVHDPHPKVRDVAHQVRAGLAEGLSPSTLERASGER